MKICLIAPPSPFATEPAMNPHLGLCYLSAYLKQKVHTAEIYGFDYAIYKDYNYNERKYLERIPECDYYAITGFSCQFKWIREIIQHISKTYPKATIITGGPHASACSQDLKDVGAHYVIKGYGEAALYHTVTGMTSNPAIDDLPIPDRELFGLHNYHRTLGGNPAIHIMTLRGCPYSCKFCHKTCVGTNVEFRSVPNVMKEIDYLIDTYGTKSFVIYDDIFTLNRDRVYYFCDQFRSRKISWRCWSRTNLITTELLHVMKKSGLTSITFGVESGNERVLKVINKGATVEQNRKALLACKAVGVPVRCSLMYGNPTEDIDSINDTIKLVRECQPDEWNLAVLAPIPGSEFWEFPEKYGIKFDKEWVKSQDYLVTNRFGKTGVGDIWIELSSMSKIEMRHDLQYMLDELEACCPRRIIQDTIQDIKVNEL